MQLLIENDLESWAEQAAKRVFETCRESSTARGVCRVALSGGSTPARLYQALVTRYAGESVWRKVEFYWGDERPVGPKDPDSNFRLARSELLDPLDISSEQVHRIEAENGAEIAAESYEAELSESFGLQGGSRPRFDLILLGLGDDAHTASLFPFSDALHERRRSVCANWVSKLETDRITLTFPVLNHARAVLFLVTGGSKSTAVRDVLRRPYRPSKYPAQAVRPADGQLTWMLDREAASAI